MVESNAMSYALSDSGIAPNSFRWKTALVVLIAVAVRLLFVVAIEKGVVRTLSNPDSSGYLSCAYNLSTGVGFAQAVDDQKPFSRPVQFSAWRPPLYPGILAIAFQFSRDALFLRLLQVSFAGLSAYFFLRLAFILFGEWPALVAGMVFALYPPLILYSADLGTETPFLLLLTAALLVFYSASRNISVPRVFCLGVLAGLAALCRPSGLVLVPSLALSIWIRTTDWKRTIRLAAVLGLAASMIVLPWTYRNYRLFHKFVLISTNGGATLWAGAYLRLVPGATLAEVGYTQHGALPEMSEIERERYYYRQAFEILDHSPRRFGKMFVLNFVAMYTLVPSETYHNAGDRLVYSISYIPLLVSGLGGFWLLRRRWRELSLLWTFIVANTAFYCLYLAAIRYRVPTIDPILMLGSGVCLCCFVGYRVGIASS
jgi:4-amino-4-deoxy-L-arabinose transferase-like glycosyltransferase